MLLCPCVWGRVSVKVLITFVVDLVLYFFMIHNTCQGRYNSSSNDGFGTILIDKFLKVTAFIIIGALTTITLVPRSSNAATAAKTTFSNIAMSGFGRLCGSSLRNVTASKGSASTVEVGSIGRNGGAIRFTVGSSIGNQTEISGSKGVSRLL